MTKTVQVLPYDARWPVQYEKEVAQIKAVLRDTIIAVHHIGSTSVPGLAAKKDLDILLVIDDLKNTSPLQNVGYIYKGEFNIPLRFFFSKNTGETKVNLDTCTPDHGFIALNLAFRDFLRKNADVRHAYQELKYHILTDPDASEKTPHRFTNYSMRKDAFINKAIGLSGHQKTTIKFCFHDREWKAAAHLRRLLEKGDSPTTWIQHHKDHKHFILYVGCTIVAYAHMQLFIDQQAVLQTLIVDPTHQGKGLGKTLMQCLEKWLHIHHYKSLHIPCPLTAVPFFEKQQYQPMPFPALDKKEMHAQSQTFGKILSNLHDD